MFRLKTSCNVMFPWSSHYLVSSYTISVLVALGVLYTHDSCEHISPVSVIIRIPNTSITQVGWRGRFGTDKEPRNWVREWLPRYRESFFLNSDIHLVSSTILSYRERFPSLVSKTDVYPRKDYFLVQCSIRFHPNDSGKVSRSSRLCLYTLNCPPVVSTALQVNWFPFSRFIVRPLSKVHSFVSLSIRYFLRTSDYPMQNLCRYP